MLTNPACVFDRWTSIKQIERENKKSHLENDRLLILVTIIKEGNHRFLDIILQDLHFSLFQTVNVHSI